MGPSAVAFPDGFYCALPDAHVNGDPGCIWSRRQAGAMRPDCRAGGVGNSMTWVTVTQVQSRKGVGLVQEKT